MNDLYGEPYYVYNNFNDMLTGILTLFYNIVLNNWQYEANMFVFVKNDNKYYLLYWFAWYIILPVLCYNIMIGLIIDYLVFSSGDPADSDLYKMLCDSIHENPEITKEKVMSIRKSVKQ